jgi:hypothetical protein
MLADCHGLSRFADAVFRLAVDGSEKMVLILSREPKW